MKLKEFIYNARLLMEPGEYLDCGIKWSSDLKQIVWFVSVKTERVKTIINESVQPGFWENYDTSPLNVLHCLSYILGNRDDNIKFIEFNDGDL